MLRKFVMWGGIALFLSVAFGAFGAHMLKGRLTSDMLEVWQTGVHYEMVHGLAVLLIGLLSDKLAAKKLVNLSGNLMLWGILLFSGSLYVLALSGKSILGAITPLGGVCFLVGWLLLIWSAAKQAK